MKALVNKRFRLWLMGCVALATAAHMVRADGKFLFSERSESDYIEVKKVSVNPFKFKFSLCRAEAGCTPFGKKQGYTLEEVRIPLFKLLDKREAGHLSSGEAHDLETLQEIIRGIESPRLRFPERGYLHYFKGSPDHLARVIEERLSSK